jgi:hypothetical protein
MLVRCLTLAALLSQTSAEAPLPPSEVAAPPSLPRTTEVAALELQSHPSREVAACDGASTKLPADQCAAWQAFWDGAGGANWVNFGKGCTRTDPCGCFNSGNPVCNDAGTTVTMMCVPARCATRRATPPARAPAAAARCCTPPLASAARAASAADLPSFPRPASPLATRAVAWQTPT